MDDLGGTGMDWASGDADLLLRWSNDQLTRYLNEAQKEAAKRSKMFLDASFRLNLREGVSLYSRDPKIIQVQAATLASTGDDIAVNQSVMDLQRIHDWESATGRPVALVADYKPNQFFVFRQPVVDDTINLVVYRYPNEDFSWACRSQEIEFADEYAYPLIHMAASLAYLKDEQNTRDLDRSQYYEAKFSAEFGSKESTASELKKGRRYPREALYHGSRPHNGSFVRSRRRKNPYGACSGR